MDIGWLSLLPPLFAIGLAVVTRRVILSLAIACYVGVLIFEIAQPEHASLPWLVVVDAPWLLAKDHLWHAVTEGNAFPQAIFRSDHLRVFYFTMLFGALVGILHSSGSMRSFVARLANRITTRCSAQLLIWLSGLLVFFDDYANTLLVGSTMRSTADRMRLSREKLAYLVDSTAAPVAGLSLISTWVATEINYMSEGLVAAGDLERTGFDLFLQSLPYRFYPIYAISLVAIIAWTGKDFGSMRACEAEAMERPEAEGDDLNERLQDAPAWSAIVSIGATIAAILFVLYRTGSVDDVELQGLRYWGQHVGNADPYGALIWGGLVGSFVALTTSRCFSRRSLKVLLLGAMDGMKNLLPAMAILLLAWALSRLTTEPFLNTQGFLGDWIKHSDVSPVWIPTMVFVVAGMVAFSTGTSWGTMGLLIPLSIPVALAASSDPIILYATAGSVLSGAIFGDHCSPISDTTVLSSQASGCDHIRHVKTQIPYALLAATISIFIGSIPAAMGVSPWWLMLVALIVMPIAVYGLSALHPNKPCTNH